MKKILFMTSEEKREQIEIQKEAARELIEEKNKENMLLFIQHEIFDRHFAELKKPKISLICKENITVDDLIFICQQLKKTGLLHKTVIPTNFVEVFNKGSIADRIGWTGSNPELATLVYCLTGQEPKPALIKLLFTTKKKYDSQSVKRIENKKIIGLIEAAAK